MRNLLVAEWTKATTGRVLPGLALGAALLSSTTAYGYAAMADPDVEPKSPIDLASITGEVVRSWMMVFLFAAIFGAVFVTREYSARTIGRSVLLSAGRGRLLTAKVTVATTVGVLFGLLAVVLGLISAPILLNLVGAHSEFTRDAWLTAAGVFVCCVAASAWGALLGWIIRNQAAAITTVIVLTLLVDPAVQQVVPEASSYLLTIALSALYRDGKPELLDIPWALLVVLGWLAAAFLLARWRLLTHDVS